MKNGICISICARTAVELFEKIARAELLADVIEVRFDCLDHGELDIALDDNSPSSLQGQGELYGKVTEICLQNPSCRVLQTWGFTDKYPWIPGHSKGKQGWALPFDAAYQRKTAYDSMLRALQSK